MKVDRKRGSKVSIENIRERMLHVQKCDKIINRQGVFIFRLVLSTQFHNFRENLRLKVDRDVYESKSHARLPLPRATQAHRKEKNSQKNIIDGKL